METLIFTNEIYQNTFGQVSSPLEQIISTQLKKKKKEVISTMSLLEDWDGRGKHVNYDRKICYRRNDF